MDVSAAFKTLLALSLISNILLVAYFCSRVEHGAVVVMMSRLKNCLPRKQLGELGSGPAAKSSIQQWQYLDCDEGLSWVERGNSSVLGISISRGLDRPSPRLEKVPRRLTRKKGKRVQACHGVPPEDFLSSVSKKKRSQMPRSVPHKDPEGVIARVPPEDFHSSASKKKRSPMPRSVPHNDPEGVIARMPPENFQSSASKRRSQVPRSLPHNDPEGLKKV